MRWRVFLKKPASPMDVVTQKAYGYRRGDNYVYVNREARMGRTALVIHPAFKRAQQYAGRTGFRYQNL